MNKFKNMKNFLWCVEPLPKNTEFEKSSVKTINKITTAFSSTITPVSYVSDFNPITREGLCRNEKDQILESISERLKEYKIKRLGGAKVIYDFAEGLVSKQVSLIINYAEKNNFGIICVQTKAKSSRDKLFLGSFAETLSLTSVKVPILTINPTSSFSALRKLLIPIDFTGSYKQFFKKVTNLCAEVKAKLICYYVVPTPSGSSILTRATKREIEDIAEANLKRHRKEIKELEKISADAKIKFTFVSVNSSKQSVSQDIISFAKENEVDLIAVQGHAGKARGFLLGSTSRQVIRSAHCPVLVMHD